MERANVNLAKRDLPPVYRQAMRRREDEKAQLRALIGGVQLAVIGSRGEDATMEPVRDHAA